MKTHLILLLLFAGMNGFLSAQNPEIRRSTYVWNFGEERYQIQYESSLTLDNEQRPTQALYLSWPNNPFASFIREERRISYHPNGQRAAQLAFSYRDDTLRSYDHEFWDERGNLILDSTYFRAGKNEEEFAKNRYFYTYDQQGQLRERLHERWNPASQTWYNFRFSQYTYDANGCLLEQTEGLERSAPQKRWAYTYEEGCRLSSLLIQNREGINAPWINSYQALYSYEDTPDSSISRYQEAEWEPSKNEWSINAHYLEVLDPQKRLLHQRTSFPQGFSFESVRAYEGEENTYYRESYRPLASSQWIHSYEFFAAEISPEHQRNRWYIGWDTLNQHYRSHHHSERQFDEQQRTTHYEQIDSIWQNSELTQHQLEETFRYESYCDGLTRVQYQQRGVDGLAPQPIQKIEYGYLYPTDCQIQTEGFSLQLGPNPARDYLIIESEAMNDPQSKIRIVDLKGRELYFQENPLRQKRMQLSTRELQNGLYFIQITGTTYQLSQPFLKQ